VEYGEQDKGKCLTCGFLAKHTSVAPGHYAPSPRYYEIEVDERQRGACFYYHIEPGRPLTTEPACIKHAAILSNELASELERLRTEAYTLEAKSQATRENAAFNVVSNDQRSCKHWYPYWPGFSPKEHLEMYNSERLFELSQKIQADSLESSRKNFRATIVFGIIVVLLSTMQIVEVWYFSTRPTPPIIVQMPTERDEPNPPQR